jgi:hypothetical protein
MTTLSSSAGFRCQPSREASVARADLLEVPVAIGCRKIFSKVSNIDHTAHRRKRITLAWGFRVWQLCATFRQPETKNLDFAARAAEGAYLLPSRSNSTLFQPSTAG